MAILRVAFLALIMFNSACEQSSDKIDSVRTYGKCGAGFKMTNTDGVPMCDIDQASFDVNVIKVGELNLRREHASLLVTSKGSVTRFDLIMLQEQDVCVNRAMLGDTPPIQKQVTVYGRMNPRTREMNTELPDWIIADKIIPRITC